MGKHLNIPKLRFPEFSGELKQKNMGDITVWASGGTPPKDNLNCWNGDIPWISASSMRGLEYSDSELKITPLGLKIGSKLATKGSLLILVRGSMLFNKIPVGIATRDVAFNQDVKSVEVKFENSALFLLYWFISSESIIMNMVSGTGIGAGKLDLIDLKNLILNIPTLPEQTKIANFLTTVDEKLTQLKKKKSLLEQYKKGVMQKIFSQELRFKNDDGNEFADWEEKMLGEDLEIQGGYAFKSILFNKGNTKVIRIGDINPNIYLNEFKGAVSNEVPDIKYMAKKNDFLMALSGATFGKVGKIQDGGIGYINQRVALFRTKECLEFYYQLVQTEDFKNYINSIPTASAQPNISNSDVLNFLTLTPSLPEQTKIANFLSAIDDKIRHCSVQIEKMELWKKGLLQKMFV